MDEVRIIHLDEVESTQDEAQGRFDGVAPVLVTATAQRRGRGRSGAAWLNAPRLVAASLCVAPGACHPLWEGGVLPRVTLVAGLAVTDIVPIGLKWPNDLVRSGAKAGGILTEAGGDIVTVGLGLNLWWPDPPDGMAGVHDVDPGEEPGRSLPVEWAARFLDRLRAGPAAWGREEYADRCTTLGQAISWVGPDGVESTGTAIDVGDDGSLVVEAGGSTVALASGAVFHVRMG